MESLNLLISVVLPVIVTSIVSLILGRAQGKSVKVDIERKYKEMLSEEIQARRELKKQFEKLEEDNRKLRHAFTRAVAWIRLRLQPGEEMPDFFETGDITKK